MAVKIRMMRIGRRHRPFFRINAVEGRNPQCGRIIEKLGHYDPIAKDETKQVVLNTERIKAWLQKGAVPSESVSDILRKHGIEKPYEKLKELTRGKSIDAGSVNAFVKTLNLPPDAESRLLELTPQTYTGNATDQAKSI